MIGGSERKRHATTASTAAASRITIGCSDASVTSIGQKNEEVGLYFPA